MTDADLREAFKRITRKTGQEPHSVKVTSGNGEQVVLAIPNVRNRWTHVCEQLAQLGAWARLELLDKRGALLGAVDNDQGPNLDLIDVDADGRPKMKGELASFAGLATLMLKAQQLALEEQRKYTDVLLSATLRTLDNLGARLEGLERTLDKQIKLAFDLAKAQASTGGEGSESDSMMAEFAAAWLARQAAGDDAKKGPPKGPPNGEHKKG